MPKGKKPPSGLLGIGFSLLLLGLLMLGASYVRSGDVDQPRCDGQKMGRGDRCFSAQSGLRTYDEVAASTATTLKWTLPIGIASTIGGVALMGFGATRSLRD